ncbi:hypothetical protein Cgig2_003890 [Carnegiea gigantea]|uniref:Uncharacterized protein n=1 Tax=Carnegiea gigantea TaxID=171969 RepID=A0A9Q1JTV0_9CARY|nr:hypothetical protein Cgig2_003890 [Carnegiea gigantea]
MVESEPLTSECAATGETERDRGEKLCDAAKAGDSATITSLIDGGYDVTYFGAEGLTPLMHAAKHGHAEVVRKLLEAGAPWNALSPSNFSAGDFAMENGHQEAFDVLLNAESWQCLVEGMVLQVHDQSAAYSISSSYASEVVGADGDKGISTALTPPLVCL